MKLVQVTIYQALDPEDTYLSDAAQQRTPVVYDGKEYFVRSSSTIGSQEGYVLRKFELVHFPDNSEDPELANQLFQAWLADYPNPKSQD